MKDFLFALFYQVIGAVNAAVIIGGIVWLAKRKDEKDGRKPNPEFTPPPTRHSGGYQPKPSEMPKPPTTGTSVAKPKRHKYDEYSALPYAVGTVQRFCKPILTSAIVLAEDGKIVIPPEESGTPVSGYGDGKIYGYVQTLAPDDGNDDGKAYSINPRTGEVEGYPAIDGTVYRVYFWTSGKAVKAVRVTPFDGVLKADIRGNEAPKRRWDSWDEDDAEFEKVVRYAVEHECSYQAAKLALASVCNPAEESAKPHEEVDFANAKCGDCKHYANSIDGGYCDLRRCPVKAHEKRQCHLFEKYKAPVRTTHICKNCKHYLATEEGAATGLCGMKDEITFGYNYGACFEKREGKDHE